MLARERRGQRIRDPRARSSQPIAGCVSERDDRDVGLVLTAVETGLLALIARFQAEHEHVLVVARSSAPASDRRRGCSPAVPSRLSSSTFSPASLRVSVARYAPAPISSMTSRVQVSVCAAPPVKLPERSSESVGQRRTCHLRSRCSFAVSRRRSRTARSSVVSRDGEHDRLPASDRSIGSRRAMRSPITCTCIDAHAPGRPRLTVDLIEQLGHSVVQREQRASRSSCPADSDCVQAQHARAVAERNARVTPSETTATDGARRIAEVDHARGVRRRISPSTNRRAPTNTL